MERTAQDVYEMHILVKGRVQGVGFRATTSYYAQYFGLKGTVRNLSDGRVEILAQGPKRNLEDFTEKLRNEMGLGQVEDMAIDYSVVKNPHKDFTIVT